MYRLILTPLIMQVILCDEGADHYEPIYGYRREVKP